jgi:hypothetical protein
LFAGVTANGGTMSGGAATLFPMLVHPLAVRVGVMPRDNVASTGALAAGASVNRESTGGHGGGATPDGAGERVAAAGGLDAANGLATCCRWLPADPKA